MNMSKYKKFAKEHIREQIQSKTKKKAKKVLFRMKKYYYTSSI